MGLGDRRVRLRMRDRGPIDLAPPNERPVARSVIAARPNRDFNHVGFDSFNLIRYGLLAAER